MGIKAKETLTSAGYKNSQKKNPKNRSSLSKQSHFQKYFSYYLKLYRTFHQPLQRSVVYQIFTRSNFPSIAKAKKNRELALLDIDKMLSFSLGTVKQNHFRISIMKYTAQKERVDEMERAGSQVARLQRSRLQGDFDLFDRRQRLRALAFVPHRIINRTQDLFEDLISNDQHENEEIERTVRNIEVFPQTQLQNQNRVTTNQIGQNSHGVLLREIDNQLRQVAIGFQQSDFDSEQSDLISEIL